MYFGAHVSIAGGILNAPANAAKIGCEIFQMFTRSPQGGHVSPLDETLGKEFQKKCAELGFTQWVVHAPYIINFASGTPRIRHGSVTIVRQELERASLIGARYVMFHIGSYKDLGREEGFKQVIEGLTEVMNGYKGSTELLIENSAGAGEVAGDTFDEIAEVLNHKNLKKYPIGVCFDTEHAFASGYDLRTPETVAQTLAKFDSTIGLKRLKMFHCNDSKIELGGHKDRHEHIGEGYIGEKGFAALFADKRLSGLPFIAETEHDKIVQDLELLKKIRKENVGA